jgi:large subunit ribosomal protein L21e
MSLRRRTRDKLRKKRMENPVMRVIREYPVGSRVHIKINPSFHKGMPHPRFYGRTGEVTGKQGEAYLVKIKDGKREKMIIVSSHHLSPEK